MKIGSVEMSALARMAPMAGITNAPFRLIVRECGSGLTTTEEMDASALLTNHPHADAIAAYYPEERPLAMQLLGKDADLLARAAERCQVLGADIVDLNMGCPMPKITGKGKGAALMRDVTGTALILRALKKALSVPFTVKIRGGWDDEHLNAVEVAQMAEAEGVDAITVHPRTRSQRFTGRAPWTIIKEVVEAVRIPVTGNGDVKLDGRGPPDGRRDGLRLRDDRPRRARQPVDLRRGLRRPIARGSARLQGPHHRPALRADPHPLPREVRPHPDEEAPGLVHGRPGPRRPLPRRDLPDPHTGRSLATSSSATGRPQAPSASPLRALVTPVRP